MSDFIEEFYYGNIEPQECTTELKPKVMKCLKLHTTETEIIIVPLQIKA